MVMKKAFADLAAIAAIGVAASLPTQANAWWEWDLGKAYTSDHAAYHSAARVAPGYDAYGYRSGAEWRERSAAPKRPVR